MWQKNFPLVHENKQAISNRMKKLFQNFTDSMDMSLSKLQKLVMYTEAWHVAIHRAAKSQTRLSDWTMTLSVYLPYFSENSKGVERVFPHS